MIKIYSSEDAERLRVIQMYLSGAYTRKMAAMNLHVTERQITRIIQKYIEFGPESVIHGNAGKRPRNRHPDEFRAKIVSLYTEKYSNDRTRLNFCHFKDKLADEGIQISYSSLRRILVANGIQPPESRVPRVISPPRPRRTFAGELLQVDASTHNWLYKDPHHYTLHGAIDDATGIITGLWLERAETMHGYQMVLLQTMKQYGMPRCFYTDNRTIFEAAKRKTVKSRLNSPRFRSMLTRLGIDVISTSNSRAKGRIERVWRTLQSRLLNELYLRGITTIEEANAFIKDYLPILNKAFASTIDPNKNSFRAVPAEYDYNQSLALNKAIKVHGGCYVVISGHYFVVKEKNKTTTSEHAKLPNIVELYQFLDGSYHILASGEWYDLEDIGPRSMRQDLVSEEKRTTPLNTPWRQYNPNFMNRDRAKWDDENLRKSPFA